MGMEVEKIGAERRAEREEEGGQRAEGSRRRTQIKPICSAL